MTLILILLSHNQLQAISFLSLETQSKKTFRVLFLQLPYEYCMSINSHFGSKPFLTIIKTPLFYFLFWLSLFLFPSQETLLHIETMSSGGSFRSTSSGKKSKHQHFQVCFCFQRMFKLRMAEPPEEIRVIFEDYSESGTMSVDNLYRFLVKFQGEEAGDATKNKAQTIFDRTLKLKHLNLFQRKGLHVEAFFHYLLGDHNGPLAEVQHDMNSPLAHYFLYTGHNSYLTGNQFSSKSSTSPIIKALKKGVRVIELDLWPNSRGNGVDVRHGGTMTSPVTLEDCLKAIKENAFYASEYPVVITFEDHITRPLQAKVAKMVNDIFGNMLHRPDSQHMEQFPSPESLRQKILISTKPPENPEDQGASVQEQGAERSEDTYDTYEQYDSDYQSEEDDGLEYRNLISIHAGKPKGHIENWLVSHSKARRLSLSEDQLEDIVRTHGTDIVRFTQKNMLRIYPKATRVDSSNYDPMVGWMHGAQMVAFNMQGHGHYLRMMEGMFRANRGCGYVKKPDILLNVGPKNEVFDPRASRQIQKTLQVLVYMGEGWHADFNTTDFDFYSPPDFSVRLHIHGVPADTNTKTTRTIEDQWVPVWNEEFSFPLTVPELALLYIKVVENDFSVSHDFGGQTCLPVSELREGIRAVRLCDRTGQTYKSTRLLIQFRFC